jgi:dihydroorotase
MTNVVIQHGRIVDPASHRDEMADLFIQDGRIVAEPPPPPLEAIDASGLIVAPGLIDLHVHLREPGQAHKETIETGAAAAAAGGFTSIFFMPKTKPPHDNPSSVGWVVDPARQVALSDDGRCVQNHELMRRAVEYARMFDVPVLDHCQDYSLVGNGVMHEGRWSTILGLPGWPRAGEELVVMRNLLLAELCGTQIHCQHLTSAGSIRLLREAKRRGIALSGEICPHHIALTDERIATFDTNFKMNPPLRTEADIEALIEAVVDDTVSILASDHAPHAHFEKEVEFDQAPFGVIGLETELGLFSTLLVHRRQAIKLPRLIEMYTANPAKLLRLPKGTLAVGAAADVTLISPDLEWVYRVDKGFSKSRNSPFDGWELKGRAVRTIVAGRTVWRL